MMSSEKIYKIVMVRPNGVIAPFVNDDMCMALEELGHEVMSLDCVKIDKEFEAVGMKVWNRIIQEIRDFKPDFSVCYGVAGVVIFEGVHQDGNHLFKEMGIPVFPFYFDDPIFTNGLQPDLKWPKEDLIFVWDKGHLERMKKLGYQKLYHIPLGTNEKKFKPLKKKYSLFKHQMSFVGSIADANEIVKPISGADPILQDVFKTVVQRRVEAPEQPIHELMREVSLTLEEAEWQRWKKFEGTKVYWVLVDHVYKLVNAIWREQVVTSIAMNNISVSVYGNENWKKLEVDYCGGLDYHQQLPRLYSSCPLHLNLSAPQLFKAVNNRVFDVLACESMVLSDWREELGDYLEPGKEILVFHSVEEAVELAKEWASRGRELSQMAQLGRKAVLAHHTWKHRMSEAVEVISKELC